MAWVEVIEKRDRKSKTWKDTENINKFSFYTNMNTYLHYERDLDSGVFDSQIDCSPVRIDNELFDGWKVDQSGWHYALGKDIANHGNVDGWIGIGGRQGQHWLKLRLLRVGYLHYPTRSWQDIGGAPNYNRSNLSNEIRTVDFPNGESQNVQSIAKWNNIWATPGGGSISARWMPEGKMLKEEIIVNQEGREWIIANRPPLTKAEETWFGFVFQVDATDIPQWIKNNVVQNINGDFDDSDGNIELRDALDRFLALFPIDFAWSESDPDQKIRLRKRLWKDGDGNTYLLLGALSTELSNLPDGNILFDPSPITIQPDGTDGIDNWMLSSFATTNFGTSNGLWAGKNNPLNRIYRSLIKFNLSDLPAEATITLATLSLYILSVAQMQTGVFNIYRCKRDWSESQSTWNIYSTGNNWQTAGGFGSNDCEQTEISSLTIEYPSDYDIREVWTFTPITKSDLDLGYGWLFKTVAESGDAIAFASSDHATADDRPILYIEYTEGTTSNIKNFDGIPWATVKNINGIPIADIKKINGMPV